MKLLTIVASLMLIGLNIHAEEGAAKEPAKAATPTPVVKVEKKAATPAAPVQKPSK